MTARNVTVNVSIAVRVDGDASAQEVGQLVAGQIVLPVMEVGQFRQRTTITPLRVELERAHEKGVG